MNARDIALVRESYASVAPLAPQAAALFYDRVFERAPSVSKLFRGNMADQGERLMAMIGVAVGRLDKMETLNGVLADLGRRHADYGVHAAHYEVVGGALLDTLAAAMGPAYSPEHRAAWAAFYRHVSCVMQSPQLASNKS